MPRTIFNSITNSNILSIPGATGPAGGGGGGGGGGEGVT